MSNPAGSDERSWEADKRDFVADRRQDVADERDKVADERDGLADERERLADERESGLDEREREIDARAASLGVESAPGDVHERWAAHRVEAAAQRQRGGGDREAAADERDTAAAERQSADKSRWAATPTTHLAMAFAEIARHLFEAKDFDAVLARIVETAVTAVAGCARSSMTLRDGAGAFRTAAATDDTALAVDLAQYAAHEGPCLDALDEPVVHVPFLPDPRWPVLGDGLTAAGVKSVASFRVTVSRGLDESAGGASLNAYGDHPDAFDTEALEIGLILAAHASVTVQAMREREAVADLGRQLQRALSSRDVIELAKGILMERLRVSPEDAFDLLRRSSRRLNVKLRDVAQRLTQTGQFESSGPS